MSTITGSVTKKKGTARTKWKLTMRATEKLTPAASAEFIEKLKKLLTQYDIKLEKITG